MQTMTEGENFDDLIQWMSLSEESLFYPGGTSRFFRLTGFVPSTLWERCDAVDDVDGLYFKIQNVSGGGEEKIRELEEGIKALCERHERADFSTLQEYRLGCLARLWKARRQRWRWRTSPPGGKNAATGTWVSRSIERGTFPADVSLALVFPMLESQARLDPTLRATSVDILLGMLRQCPASSLGATAGGAVAFDGMEDLLCTWLASGTSNGEIGTKLMEAIVLLACARDSEMTYLRVVDLITRCERSLPCALIGARLNRLFDGEMDRDASGEVGAMTSLQEEQLLDSFTYDSDHFSGSGEKVSVSEEDDLDDKSTIPRRRFTTTDGKYIFTSDAKGVHVFRIGTGLDETVKGYTYSKNRSSTNPSFLAFADGVLLRRPINYDKISVPISFAQVLSTDTLEEVCSIRFAEELVVDGSFVTLQLTSNGKEFYWVRAIDCGDDESSSTKPLQITVDIFSIENNKVKTKSMRKVYLYCCNQEVHGRIGDGCDENSRFNDSTNSSPPEYGNQSRLKPGNHMLDSRSTSVGVLMAYLHQSLIFSCGTFITFILPPIKNNKSSKTGTSLKSKPYRLSFSLNSGEIQSGIEAKNKPNLPSLDLSSSISSNSATYDAWNDIIWVIDSDRVSSFATVGGFSSANSLSRLGITEGDNKLCTPENDKYLLSTPQEICKVFTRHIGLMSVEKLSRGNTLRKLPLDAFDSTTERHMCMLLNLLRLYLKKKDHISLSCLFSCFEAELESMDLENIANSDYSELKNIGDFFWSYLSASSESDLSQENGQYIQIMHQSCRIYAKLFDSLHANPRKKDLFLRELSRKKSYSSHFLQNMIFQNYYDKILKQHNSDNRKEVKDFVINNQLFFKSVIQLTIEEGHLMLCEAIKLAPKAYIKLLINLPTKSHSVQLLSALTNLLLQMLIEVREEKAPFWEVGLELVTYIFNGCESLLNTVLDVVKSISSLSDGETQEIRINGMEKIIMSTILGHVFPLLLALLNHEQFQSLQLAENFITQVVRVYNLTCESSVIMAQITEKISLQDKDHCERKDSSPSCSSPVENVAIGEELEKGYLARVRPNMPWTHAKVIESVHPLKENYKFKRTVRVPDARALLLRFDPRCSSQYEYDKLSIFAGSNQQQKVAEFGGNSYETSAGRSAPKWPQDSLKLDGDTVTLTFEMRSSREKTTTDQDIWGFRVIVSPLEIDDAKKVSLLADLVLGVSELACQHLKILYDGPKLSMEEVECKELLMSKLLQRCIWQNESIRRPKTGSSEEDKPENLPRIKISLDIIKKLRYLANFAAPQVRKSIFDDIQPFCLEESIISVVVKHLSLNEIILNLDSFEESNSAEYFLLIDIMTETYQKLGALIRRLMTFAELEQQWENEVIDISEEKKTINDAFFIDYYGHEAKSKNLYLLCFLKDISTENKSNENMIADLKEKLRSETMTNSMELDTSTKGKTKQLVKGILERVELLLSVSIYTNLDYTAESNNDFMSTSLQQWPDGKDKKIRRTASTLDFERSLDDSVLQIPKLKRKRNIRKIKGPKPVIQGLTGGELLQGKSPHSQVVEQVFAFVGSNPEDAVSCDLFLKASKLRNYRSKTRKLSLNLMKELISSSHTYGGCINFVLSLSPIIKDGSGVEQLACGGMQEEVKDAFTEMLTSLVQAINNYPMSCQYSLGILCTIPYDRCEEKCLVKSGLLGLLDRLCSLQNFEKRSDDQLFERIRALSAMAWGGFQVLADRCVKWEEDQSADDNFEVSGFARQVSHLITNNVIRVAVPDAIDAGDTLALHEILMLLHYLSGRQLGKAILSQAACISKLLSLLLQPRLSPQMIQILIKLCHMALPLISHDKCEEIELPDWCLGSSILSGKNVKITTKIVFLIFGKLADYLVPGFQISASKGHRVKTTNNQCYNQETAINPSSSRVLSVFVYKRCDQNAQEIVQQILEMNNEIRLFQTIDSVDQVAKLEKELQKFNKVEVFTDDATLSLQKAIKLTQAGFLASVAPSKKSLHKDEERKKTVELIAHERNLYLSKYDPARPFISSSVCNRMAAELIDLIYSLVNSNSKIEWKTSIESVLKLSFSKMVEIIHSSEALFTADQDKLQKIYMAGREVISSLAVIGGFNEIVSEGSEVIVMDEGNEECYATVSRIDNDKNTAEISLVHEEKSACASNPKRIVLKVPMDRLKTRPRNVENTMTLTISETLIETLESMLLPDATGISALDSALPAQGDGQNLKNATSRLLCEIRTRACMVLSHCLEDPEFASSFLQKSCQAVDMLKVLSKDVQASDRHKSVDIYCNRLRFLYRDCVKPSAPPIKRQDKVNVVEWDLTKSFPPLKSLLLTHNNLGITSYENPTMSSGYPRGSYIYTNHPINSSMNLFYWEIEIISLGGSNEDNSVPVISLGLSSSSIKKEDVWNYPVGSVFFHNNGRAVHYNGSSLLHWKSHRFELTFNPGDVIGIGWKKMARDQEMVNSNENSGFGTVFFTYNGIRQTPTMEGVSSNLHPTIHIQKNGVRIKANFGTQNFVYTDSSLKLFHMFQTDEYCDPKQNCSFEVLPYYSPSSENEASNGKYVTGAGHRRINHQLCRTALHQEPPKIYDTAQSSHYERSFGNAVLINTGLRENYIAEPTDCDEDGDDEDTDDDEDELISPSVDLNKQLLKSWETKIFPVIRRRFRNEAERRDGLEQIRGALSLGMTEIAKQTVEFLYEENGGIPKDMHLPTIEDIKKDLSKFSIDRAKTGTMVTICRSNSVEAPFSVPEMSKTFGLNGEILEIDAEKELVLIETYLKNEGVLQRFWYPAASLEISNKDLKKVSVTGTQVVNTNNTHVQKELFNWEFASSRMYIREAYLKLVKYALNNTLQLPMEARTSKHTMMSANLLLLQDFDIENLQFLTNEALIDIYGNTDSRINSTEYKSAKKCLQNATLVTSNMFVENPAILKRYIENMIGKASASKSECIVELASKICSCMLLAPEYFRVEQFNFSRSDGEVNSVIQFPDASFIMVSCAPETLAEVPNEKVILETFDGSQVRKSGQIKSKCLIEYPQKMESDKLVWKETHPTALISADKIKVKYFGDNKIDLELNISSIPQEFPLAVMFLEAVVELYISGRYSNIPSSIIDVSLDALCGSLLKYQYPVLIKTNLFFLLSELLHLSKIHCNGTSLRKWQTLLITSVTEELDILHDVECKAEPRKYSKYFQSLFEVCASTEDMLKKPEDEVLTFRMGSSSKGNNQSQWLKVAFESLKNFRRVVFRQGKASGVEGCKLARVDRSEAHPTDCDRLLVLKNIPLHLDENEVKMAVAKATRITGGIFRDDIFLTTLANNESDRETIFTRIAVFQLRSTARRDTAIKELINSKLLTSSDDDIVEELPLNASARIQIQRLDSEYKTEDPDTNNAVKNYLLQKIFATGERNKATNKFESVLSQIFRSGLETRSHQSNQSNCIPLADVVGKTTNTLLCKYFRSIIDEASTANDLAEVLNVCTEKICNIKEEFDDQMTLNSATKCNLLQVSKIDDKLGTSQVDFLTEKTFKQFVLASSKEDPLKVMKALNSCGFDFFLDSIRATDQVPECWSLEKDEALVDLINSLALDLSIASKQLEPNEIYVSAAKAGSTEYSILADVPVSWLRSRCAELQELNESLQENLVPMASMEAAVIYPHSVANQLARGKRILFYDTKNSLLDEALGLGCLRAPEQPPPEIVLDPLKNIGAGNSFGGLLSTHFYEAMLQLADVPSARMCVAVASGGDPAFPFNVRYAGEVVHGTSGSFRQFLSAVVVELHSPDVGLSVPVKGVPEHENCFHLKPGPVDYLEEKLLLFLGQILGVVVRSGIPLPLRLTEVFWKRLLDLPLSETTDLARFDPVTARYLRRIDAIETAEEFEEFVEEYHRPRFVYPSIGSEDEHFELCDEGAEKEVTWPELRRYSSLVREFRMRELESRYRYDLIRAGLASVLPANLLTTLFTPGELELRVCGLSGDVEVAYLRMHTIYQSGVSEEDEHVRFFWSVLENFTRAEMNRFVKFACNQQRLPRTDPKDSANVPPFPMKIAPADNLDVFPDLLHIRVETCMFMVKLPQYSTFEITKKRLDYAIYCDQDPLTS